MHEDVTVTWSLHWFGKHEGKQLQNKKGRHKSNTSHTTLSVNKTHKCRSLSCPTTPIHIHNSFTKPYIRTICNKACHSLSLTLLKTNLKEASSKPKVSKPVSYHLPFFFFFHNIFSFIKVYYQHLKPFFW